MDIIDRQQRETWFEARERLGLVPDHPGLGREGVMRALDGQSVQVTFLPADPLAWVADFDEPLMSALPRHFTGRMTGQGLTLTQQDLLCDHMMRLAQGNTEGVHRAVGAVHRNGGVTVGLSEAEGLRDIDNYGERQRVSLLFVIVGAVRLALLAQEQVLAALDERNASPGGPWETSVALPGAAGAWLGGAAEGWEDLRHAFHRPTCAGPTPLVHAEMPAVPRGEDERRAALTRTVARVVNAFGTYSRLHIPRDDVSGVITDAY